MAAPHLVEHRLRDELPRAQRAIEGEEILGGRVAAPAPVGLVFDSRAVARQLEPTGPVFANISRSIASDKLGYNHKPTGEP